MLELRNISKQYQTGTLVQKALDDVSLTLRDNEFVCILGPSGSGKTTLLNIIGGLDRYDSGDLLINGVSTKAYHDRDWDTYRNHTIGFVFQSYNLIPHQTVLSNIELSMTIGGVSRSERRRRAKEALAAVGLEGQEHKRPNQMSGGQMQRVAIARALVNNPDILLADEPTGALDSETSTQVMDLLRQVAKDRLVVMVTHNAELAAEYATRIVNLRDGRIVGDSHPCEKEEAAPKEEMKGRRARMSFRTALQLSFQNLRTKKGRTILTAFAGSIGIIGIALILALSSSVNRYIADIQKETMSSYPITITAQTMDLTSLMTSDDTSLSTLLDRSGAAAPDSIKADFSAIEVQTTMANSIKENNLSAFKRYLDDENSPIHSHIGEHGVQYSYNVLFEVYAYDSEGRLINTNADPNDSETRNAYAGGMEYMRTMYSYFGRRSNTGADNFSELMPGTNGAAVSQVVKDSYDLVWGRWPEKADELILSLNYSDRLTLRTLYQFGFITAEEYRQAVEAVQAGRPAPDLHWSFDSLAEHRLVLIPASARYQMRDDGTYTTVGDSDEELAALAEKGIPLRIVGVIRQNDSLAASTLLTRVGYTTLLTKQIIDLGNESEVVKAQLASPAVSVVSGQPFGDQSREHKIEAARQWVRQNREVLEAYGGSGSSFDFSSFDQETVDRIVSRLGEEYPQLSGLLSMLSMIDPSALGGGDFSMDGLMNLISEVLADEAIDSMSDDQLLQIYDMMVAEETLASNLTSFGYVDVASPNSISIYADSFEAKDAIAEDIRKYNTTAAEDEKITYTDYIALITSSITTIVDVISYILIAFVAVSLVVSSIMIGIITHISVLERTKEIGILRALGASKKNISQVFNAETVIIGLFAGVLGVSIAALFTLPVNAILFALTKDALLHVALQLHHALILVAISVIVTVIGGLIPAHKAASKDPVIALRTE